MDNKHELLLEHAELDNERTDVIMALLRTASLIDRACATELAAFDLSEGRLSVLLATAQADSTATPASIAEQLGVTRAAVTGLLDGLDKQGLIERRGNPGDRRSTTITLTPSGDATLATLRPVYGDWLQQVARDLSPEVVTGMRAALATIQHNLTDEKRDA